ncbi:PEP/pyruvate-binding domain-containing protein [Dactylosporangium sp. NPDC050588]|uniref:PEP/pyruvate-binding domain-containing protein n=1 Tax=Dactylosporangium sp. NPDC050588 TaxID=3157211 RepID=UPI00340DF856
MTVFTRALDDPACADPAEAGGKAAGLAGLARAGLPVSAGFVVTVPAHRAFVAARGTVPAAVADAVRQSYERLGGGKDVAVAVRSSGTTEDGTTASLAGRFDTWLDVTGAEAVLDHVRRCWTGTARSPGTGMGVVVQRMVRARAAGVMFTVSPVTGDRSRIVVEAGWGLGLAVVGGEITPDRWTVDKVGLTVVERVAGDKRIEYRRGHLAVAVTGARRERLCLSDDEVLELAALGKRVEREEGRAQDVEFAFGDDGLVLLQRRPETVWSNRARPPRFAAGQGVTAWIGAAVTAGPTQQSPGGLT